MSAESLERWSFENLAQSTDSGYSLRSSINEPPKPHASLTMVLGPEANVGNSSSSSSNNNSGTSNGNISTAAHMRTPNSIKPLHIQRRYVKERAESAGSDATSPFPFGHTGSSHNHQVPLSRTPSTTQSGYRKGSVQQHHNMHHSQIANATPRSSVYSDRAVYILSRQHSTSNKNSSRASSISLLDVGEGGGRVSGTQTREMQHQQPGIPPPVYIPPSHQQRFNEEHLTSSLHSLLTDEQSSNRSVQMHYQPQNRGMQQTTPTSTLISTPRHHPVRASNNSHSHSHSTSNGNSNSNSSSSSRPSSIIQIGAAAYQEPKAGLNARNLPYSNPQGGSPIEKGHSGSWDGSPNRQPYSRSSNNNSNNSNSNQAASTNYRPIEGSNGNNGGTNSRNNRAGNNAGSSNMGRGRSSNMGRGRSSSTGLAHKTYGLADADTAPMNQLEYMQTQRIRIERDYSKGDARQFSTEFPNALAGRVDRARFKRFVEKINGMLAEAENATVKNVVEGVLGVATLYLSTLVLRSHFQKTVRRISRLIDAENECLFRPAGYFVLDPRQTAYIFIEIAPL